MPIADPPAETCLFIARKGAVSGYATVFLI
jgi:hypothetical protein